MKTAELIGIVGLGDLGGKLRVQAEVNGFKTLGFEPFVPRLPLSAIDESIDISGMSWPPCTVETLEELVEQTSTVHWCAPLRTLNALKNFPDRSTLVLHNSTMDGSVRAREKLRGRGFMGEIAVVHCLMNEENMVAIANNFGNPADIVEHFEDLGLNTEVLKYDEADNIAAQSQGIFALLIRMGLKDKLREWGENGLLTPSAREAQAALAKRALKWTDETIEAIMSNPYLVKFAQEILETAIKGNMQNQ